MWRSFVRREMLLLYREWLDWLQPVVFFVLIACLFPMTMDPKPSLLRLLAPGVVWVAVLLTQLLSLDRLFKRDYFDGSLDLLLTADEPLALLVWLKWGIHWLALLIPMLLFTPLLGLLYGLTLAKIALLMLTLTLGTPTLYALGAIYAALTLSVRQSGLLLGVLALPLMIPVLIFATTAVMAVGEVREASLAWLLILALLASIAAPWACAKTLRMMLGYSID